MSTVPTALLIGTTHTSIWSAPSSAATLSLPKMQSTPPELNSTAVPVTVTSVPPVTGPRLGFASQVPDSILYSYRTPVDPSCCPAPLDTVTITDPGPCSGAVHATIVDVTYRPAAMPTSPNRQLRSCPCSKWLPAIVTTCPTVPLTPHDGTTASTVAPLSYMYVLPSLVKSAPSLTLTSTATGPVCPSTTPGAMHEILVDVEYDASRCC